MKRASTTILLVILLTPFLFAEGGSSFNWRAMQWKEQGTTIPISIDNDGITHIGEITSFNVFSLKSDRYFPAKSGDDVIYTAKIYGSGNAVIKLRYFDKTKRWCGFSQRSIDVHFTKTWTDLKAVIPVFDTPRGRVDSILITMEMDPGSECYITNSSCSVENNGLTSELTFPTEWAGFILGEAPEDLDYPLDMIPEEINGIHYKLVTSKNNLIDFRQDFANFKPQSSALLYAYLYSPLDTTYLIGAGADYYMTIYVNGETVLDTMESGNRTNLVHFSNFQQKINLRRGHNLIIIHFKSGESKYPCISLGGPDALKNMQSTLKVRYFQQKGDTKHKTKFNTPDAPGEKIQYEDGEVITAKYRPFLFKLNDSTLTAMGLKLYDMPTDGKVNYKMGDSLEMNISRNKLTGGFIVSIRQDGSELENIHLPQDICPCNIVLATNGKQYFMNASSLLTEKLASRIGNTKQQVVTKGKDMTIAMQGASITAGDFFTAIMHLDSEQQ